MTVLCDSLGTEVQHTEEGWLAGERLSWAASRGCGVQQSLQATARPPGFLGVLVHHTGLPFLERKWKKQETNEEEKGLRS